MSREPPIGKPIRAAFFISCARKQLFVGELGKWNGLQNRFPGVRYLPPMLGACPVFPGLAWFFDIYTAEQTFLVTRVRRTQCAADTSDGSNRHADAVAVGSDSRWRRG